MLTERSPSEPCGRPGVKSLLRRGYQMMASAFRLHCEITPLYAGITSDQDAILRVIELDAIGTAER